MSASPHRERVVKFLRPVADDAAIDEEDFTDLVDHLVEHFDQVDWHGEERGRRLQSAEATPGFRILSTDNFGGDYPGEWFVAVGIRDQHTAEVMADSLNARAGEHAARFYRVVSADYELQPGFEP